MISTWSSMSCLIGSLALFMFPMFPLEYSYVLIAVLVVWIHLTPVSAWRNTFWYPDLDILSWPDPLSPWHKAKQLGIKLLGYAFSLEVQHEAEKESGQTWSVFTCRQQVFCACVPERLSFFVLEIKKKTCQYGAGCGLLSLVWDIRNPPICAF